MKIKSLLVFAAVLLIGSNNLFAQEQSEKQIKEPGKVEFNPHWYMQIQAGAAHTVGEAKFKDLISPAAALNFGYQFNPILGMRFGASGWQAKGGWVTNPKATYKFNYLQGNVDAVFNLSNLFGKFNPERTFDWYAFLGAGFNYAFNNDEAVTLAAQGAKMEYLWEDSKTSIVGRGGLGLNIRLSDRVAFNVEANANTLSDRFNSKKAGNIDWQFNGLVGLTIKFGKSYTKTEPVYYEPTPVTEPKPVVKEEPKAEPKPVVKVEPMIQNIFFDINKSVIRQDQAYKIDELVSYMNKYPNAKLAIVGYADKGTGNTKINDRLSKERAASVYEALKAKGISENRIITDAKGDSVQPFAENDENRVSVCIAE